MWTAVALTTMLSLAPAQGLELKNVRTTYGIMGESRKNDKFLPGDVVFVAFDIEGLQTKDDGLVKYAMGMELTKKGKAKPEFKSDPKDLEAENSLGGSTLPAFAMSAIGTDATPGEYTLKVTIKDRLAKTEKVLTKKFEVLSPKLGFVQVNLTNANFAAAPPVAFPGQRIFVHCTLVGFKLDKKKLPNIHFEMVVKDADGKPTVKTKFEGKITTDVKDTPGMMTFRPRPLDLNRPGKYKIVITATDNNNDNTKTEQTLNLTVLDQPN